MESYEIIVIGAGAAGLNIASFTNEVGLDTLLIERSEESFGGDCLNYGCVPSKALIHVADLIQNSREAERFGVEVGGKADIGRVMDYVEDKIDYIREEENPEYFREKGMDVEIGNARFTGEKKIEVEGTEFRADKIVIATGSRPRELEVPGIEEVEYLDNEKVFELEELPEELLVVGGGPIGVELGQALNRLGSDVTIAERGGRILGKEPEEVSEFMKEKLEEEGINIDLNTALERFEDGEKAVLEDQETGEEFEEILDAVLVSIGRKISLPEGLEEAGIETTEGGRLEVDSKLRTTNKDVYVLGDAAGSYMFTHAAELQAKTVINNLFSPLKSSVDYEDLPWVTYSDPEIATFGLTEEELEERGIDYRKVVEDYSEVDRGIVTDSEGMLLLYVDGEEILGGTLVAPEAGEMVQELILAKKSGLGIEDLFNKVYPYPTASRINREAATEVYSDRLTPFKKKLMRLIYRYLPF